LLGAFNPEWNASQFYGIHSVEQLLGWMRALFFKSGSPLSITNKDTALLTTGMRSCVTSKLEVWYACVVWHSMEHKGLVTTVSHTCASLTENWCIQSDCSEIILWRYFLFSQPRINLCTPKISIRTVAASLVSLIYNI